MKSQLVLALSPPPERSTSWKCSAFRTLADPWNIMCSNRWAKPLRPGTSLALPTWYQRFTVTIGVEWSSESTTWRPLDSVYVS